MVPNGLKWLQNAFLGDLGPFWGHFGRFPPHFGGGSPPRAGCALRSPGGTPGTHSHFGPHFDSMFPRSEGGGTGQNAPKTGPNRPQMRFGAILDHLEAIGDHLGPFGKVWKFSILTPFWTFFGHFWSFWGHFGSHLDPIFPQSEGGTGQNAPKTGPNRPKMRFGAILDHLEAIWDHLEKCNKFRF